MDDKELIKGEDISPSLLRAIEESRISLIVFSKYYANSSWCLDELVHIMKCRDKLGQMVFPIFYKVRPSDVRRQTCTFAKPFERHEDARHDVGPIYGRKAALTAAAYLSG